ncbi:unnamed protein product [Heligmosomoides polygyrus]|uniref:Uncharacterized protein n=1 Tax=Heligmosomoides polygyrus TaxID=6339 RepID=A0A3P7UCM0_HELPZ|nr:unnamed protein product [Heligmosomoides polygyrus]
MLLRILLTLTFFGLAQLPPPPLMPSSHQRLSHCQVLIYPVIHVFAFQLPSYLAYYEKYNGTSLLNPRAMARWILLYLGLPANKRSVEMLIESGEVKQVSNSSYTVDRQLQYKPYLLLFGRKK